MESSKKSPFRLEQLVQSPKKIWTLRELSRLFGIRHANSAYKWAERLAKRGLLKRLAKGFYAYHLVEPTVFETANALYAPSYVSLESALAYHGVLSQAPTIVTSVTPRKTKRLEVAGMTYAYSHVPPSWFTGFRLEDRATVAEPEKALVDIWYLRRMLPSNELDRSHLDISKIKTWVTRLPHARVLGAFKTWGTHSRS